MTGNITPEEEQRVSIHTDPELLKPELPADDTEPDEFGNEPRPCQECLLMLSEEDAAKTTNRGVFGAGHKLWIDPICELHAGNTDNDRSVEMLLEYAGVDFLADGVMQGVVTPTTVKAYDENVYNKLLGNEYFSRKDLPDRITIPDLTDE